MTTHDWFDPPWEQTSIILVDARTVLQAQRQIASCEMCVPDTAVIPFDCLIDGVTGCDPRLTDYVMIEPARCSRCSGPVTEKTLVKPAEWRFKRRIVPDFLELLADLFACPF
jgi:hypothetical protein